MDTASHSLSFFLDRFQRPSCRGELCSFETLKQTFGLRAPGLSTLSHGWNLAGMPQ